MSTTTLARLLWTQTLSCVSQIIYYYIFRKLGVTSRKPYLSNGGQQDGEGFLRTLIEQLMQELPPGNIFMSVSQSFWGTEKIIRKFLFTPDGKCLRCMTYPSDQ
jgi:hypothetical protein